jgi:hypothetical protein
MTDTISIDETPAEAKNAKVSVFCPSRLHFIIPYTLSGPIMWALQCLYLITMSTPNCQGAQIMAKELAEAYRIEISVTPTQVLALSKYTSVEITRI